MAMTIAIDLDISSGSVSLSRPVMELAFDGQISELRGGHLTTASLEFGGENELSECPSSAAIIGVGLVGGNERGSRALLQLQNREQCCPAQPGCRSCSESLSPSKT